jgi:hypothetical protein
MLPLIPGEWFTTFVVVANTGETAATIVESTVGFDLVMSDRLVQAPRSSGSNELGKRVIAAGQTYEFKVTSTERKVNGPITASYIPNNYGFFLAGHLTYADDAGILRQMAFWRRYDPFAERFVKTSNSGDEFEYSD